MLDTHIWIWRVQSDPRLSAQHRDLLSQKESEGLGISVISRWEVAKLVELNRLVLPLEIGQWIDHALGYPGIRLLELTPQIAIESTQLPPVFHRDPADQLIVATARTLDIGLVTVDSRIMNYPHVRTL